MSSSPTTAPGSATTNGSASSSPNSRNSASPSPRPTPAGTASHTRPARAPAGPPEPERQPPDRVGSARLTRGQLLRQEAYAQLRAKRENLSAKRPGQKLTGQLSSYTVDGSCRHTGRNLGDRVLGLAGSAQSSAG